MSNRVAFKMTTVTAIHNFILCIGSLGMFVAGIWGSIEIYQEKGIDAVFQQNHKGYTGLSPWAMYIYYLSKFPELIDTIILVLKKKNIIFLHWYHHAIVILMVWGWGESRMGVTIFGLLFNTFVHIWMYWYYFASCLGWNVWYKVMFIN
jgi:fatty acid elongase 3